MKTKIGKCSKCNEEVLHDVGKKEATSKRGAYLKRITSRCRKCGRREIKNAKQGIKIIEGKN